MSSLPFLYQDFGKGLNTKAAPFLLQDEEARDLSNVQSTRTGAILKRNGLVTLASPAVTFTSLFAAEAASPAAFIGAGGTALYSVSTGGTVTQLKSGLTNNLNWSFAQMPTISGQGPLYGMNGTDTPQYWDGSSSATANWTATSGALPNGTMCVVHQNRLFVAGVAANPSRLYWSALGDPTSWPSANVVDLDPNDGESITGIGLIGPYLAVGKSHKLFLVHDANTGANRRLSDSVGIASHRSIASGPFEMYFLSNERGVYQVDAHGKITFLSDLIQPTMDSIVTAQRNTAAGTFYQGHYYLSVCTSGSQNNITLDWDSVLSSWWKHSFGSNQFAYLHPPSTSTGLYSAKSTAAIVDQCFVPNVYTDNGTAMTWVWRGPWQSPTFYRRRRFPTPYFKKRLRQVRVMGSGTVDFSLAKDFVGNETLWRANVFGGTPPLTFSSQLDSTVFGAADSSVFGLEASVFGAGSGIQQARLYSLGAANAFSMVFGSTSTTADAVHLYAMLITDRRDNVVA